MTENKRVIHPVLRVVLFVVLYVLVHIVVQLLLGGLADALSGVLPPDMPTRWVWIGAQLLSVVLQTGVGMIAVRYLVFFTRARFADTTLHMMLGLFSFQLLFYTLMRLFNQSAVGLGPSIPGMTWLAEMMVDCLRLLQVILRHWSMEWVLEGELHLLRLSAATLRYLVWFVCALCVKRKMYGLSYGCAVALAFSAWYMQALAFVVDPFPYDYVFSTLFNGVDQLAGLTCMLLSQWLILYRGEVDTFLWWKRKPCCADGDSGDPPAAE